MDYTRQPPPTTFPRFVEPGAPSSAQSEKPRAKMPVQDKYTNGSAPGPPPSASTPASSVSSSSKSKSKGKGKLVLTSNVKELAKLLAYEERETKELHRAIITLTEQLNAERQRTSDAEDRVRTVATRLKSVNESRLAAVRDAATANEQLKLYKSQLDAAQKEIYRAQDLLYSLDERRYAAETEAARNKSALRKMNEDVLVWNAREEGRKLGMVEGLKKGKNIGYREGRQVQGHRRDTLLTESDTSEDVEEPHQFEPTPLEESFITKPRAPPTPESVRSPSIKSPAATPRAPVAPMPADPLGPLSPIGSPLGEQQSLDPVFTPNLGAAPISSPSHPPIFVPPDNFIPTVGSDSIIRLPPPHELAPPTPRMSPALSPARPPVEFEQAQFQVPPPRYNGSRTPVLDHIATSVPMDRNPRYSPESSSTTISQNPLVQEMPVLNHRPSRLSDITEVLSTSTPSPHPNAGEIGSLHHSYFEGTRSPQGSVASKLSSRQNLAVYPPALQRRGSASSARSQMTVPDINIEPPSQRSSLASAEKRPSPTTPRAARSMGNLLSPEDARRPLSPPTEPKPMEPVDGVPLGDLPPGFMPHSVQGAGQGGYYQSPYQTQGAGTSPNHAPFYPTPESPRSRPVIPAMDMMTDGGETSDSISTPASSGLNTLTTPPVNRLRLADTIGIYAHTKSPQDYPLPESVAGSATPGTRMGSRTPHGHSSFGTNPMGVPLPESTVGAATPRSASAFSSFTTKSKRSKKGSVGG